MKNKHGFRFLALCLALMMALGMASSAMAETALDGATLTTVIVDKYLVMDANANVPTAKFTFTVAPIASDIAAEGNKPQILKGIGTPTITAAEFAPLDTTFTAPQTGDTITVASGKKYAKEELTVSFANISFPAPGIYRYTITEAGDAANFGITNDPVNPLYLDVYVDSNGTDLVLQGYVLHDNTNIPDATGTSGPGNNQPSLDSKSTGFENTFDTIDLTLTKLVTGNQGFRSKDYKFKVTISGAPAGTLFDVEGARATVTPAGETDTAGGAQLTMPTTGDLVTYYYLQNNQSVVIKGLPKGATYTVEEVIEDSEGYTVSYKDYVTGTTAPTTGTNGKTDGPVTTADDDKTAEFTNYRQGVVPTGILLDIWPYLLIVAIAAAALIVLVSKKRKHATRY